MPFAVGETVGPYRIMEQLGQGGMATVFKAYHAALDRYVALKVLHPAFLEDPNFLARFQREARLVAKLDHPNIVPIYDFAEHEGRPYLVMKFVEGKTLKARLKEGPLTTGEGVAIIEKVGEALSYAHDKGVLHRDVKPSNVILCEDGQVYLTDFGLARIAAAGESTLSSETMIGTPQYISPEQAIGKKNLDEGTDIYSFGVLLYELVVGRVPYSADTPFSVVHDHIYTPLPLPRQVNPHVPEAVERLLLKALAKERADRFETVSGLVESFTRAVEGEEQPGVWAEAEPEPEIVFSPPETLITPAEEEGEEAAVQEGPQEKKPRRRRRWVPLLFLLGLCLCAFLGFAILNGQGQRPWRSTQTPAASRPTATQPERTSAPTTRPEELPPEEALEVALQNVEERPDDPFAHLRLAGAYLDVGEEALAFETFRRAEELAGEDPAFYNVAGDMLAARERWLPALEQYVQTAKLSEGDYPPGFFDKLEQAAYFAAEDPEAEELLFEVLGDRAEPGSLPYDALEAARARYVLFFEGPQQADDRLQALLDRKPDFPFARLVKAEILWTLDQPEEATVMLENLLDDERVPPWVKVEARHLLNEIGL